VRLLLDTHAFVWWASGNQALPPKVRGAIDDPNVEILVSAVSAWEITTKYRIGKWPEVATIAANVAHAIQENGFDPLPVSVEHGQHAGALSGTHRDPFDRILAAQSLLDGLTLASKDTQFDAFGVQRLW